MQRFGRVVYFFIVALSIIYSASWMFSVYKSEAQIFKKTSKDVLGASMTEYKIPSPSLAPIKSGPTPVPTSSPALNVAEATPTQSPKQENTPQPAQVQNSAGDSNNSILDKINAYRASKGLPTASSNSETCSFAKTRVEEIASNFNHDGFTQRINSKSLPYSSYSRVTENIAMTSNSTDVVDIWINSGAHAENMRADTPFICVMQNGNYFAYEGWKP